MAKVLKQKTGGRSKVKIDGVGHYGWEDEGGDSAGGGKLLLHGWVVFDTDGSGDVVTRKMGALPAHEVTPDASGNLTSPRGGAVVPAGTLKNLRVRTNDSWNGGGLNNQSLSVTVYVDSPANSDGPQGTALQVNWSSESAQVDLVDTVHTVSVPAGAVVQMKILLSAGDEPTNPVTGVAIMASVELEPS